MKCMFLLSSWRAAKRYLVGSDKHEVVWRVSDDVAFGRRILSDGARRVTKPTETEAQDAVRLQRERKQLPVQLAVLQTHDTHHVHRGDWTTLIINQSINQFISKN